MEGESREAETREREEGGPQEGKGQQTSEDKAYESLTLQLGKHFRLNSISCARGFVANPDCLGGMTSARAARLGLYCIPDVS